jgi:hypothetical protein
MTPEDLPLLLQAVNVLIIPVAVYVVRIDRRMGQIDTLSTVNQARIEKLEAQLEKAQEQILRIEYSSRHT